MADGIELFKLFATLGLDNGDFVQGIKDAQRLIKDAQEAADDLNAKMSSGMGATGYSFDRTSDGMQKTMRGVTSGAESWITKLSSGLHVVEKIGGSVVNVITGVADAGLSLVDVAASFRALDESMAAAFGDMGDQANAAFERVGQTNNILIRRLQQSGLSFFRQFKSAGMEDAEALSEMETMLGYAADAAAAYDISLEDASERMRSFIRGNVEAGEAIGLFVTQSDRQRLGLELFNEGKWQKLEEHERQAVLLARIMEIYGQSNVFGQGAREAQNWTNVVGNLTSAWEEAQAIMGEGIMDALIPALQELTNWIKENPALFKSLGETFAHVATAMVDLLKSLLLFIDAHGDDITAFFDSLNSVMSGEKSLWDVLFGGGKSKNVELRPNAEAEEALRSYAATLNGGEGIDFAALGEVVGYDVAQSFNDQLAAGVDLESAITNALTDAQVALDNATLSTTVDIVPVLKGWGNDALALLGNLFTPNAKGLDYVPYDNYVTRLHRGEKIMSRVEAENWRTTAKDFGRGADPEAIGSAVKAALAGVSVTMDGRSVGTLVTPYVSREQKAEYWRNR